MIRGNELRIGNWVAFNNHIMPVDYVQVNARFFSSLAGGRNLNEVKFDEQFNNYWDGIALIPEILEKVGFAKEQSADVDERDIWSIQVANNTSLYYDPDLNDKKWYLSHFHNNNHYQNDFWACPQYVHQLQNLYFALTSEELEIKL